MDSNPPTPKPKADRPNQPSPQPLSEGRQALLRDFRKSVAEGRNPWPYSPTKPQRSPPQMTERRKEKEETLDRINKASAILEPLGVTKFEIHSLVFEKLRAKSKKSQND